MIWTNIRVTVSITKLSMRPKLHGRESEIIQAYLRKESMASISRKYGVSDAPIKRILKKSGIAKRSRTDVNTRFEKNEEYFSEIDTEEKAYWLGFLYADGCVTKGNVLTVVLSRKDGLMLQRLSHLFYSANRVRGYSQKLKDKTHDRSMLNFVSQKTFDSLVRLGCHQRKTETLSFPTFEQVPENLIRHFVRGYFDGDGGVTLSRKNKCISASIISTHSFCESITEILSKADIHSSTYKFSHTDKVVQIRLGRVADCAKFYHFIYTGASIWMPRKRLGFLTGLSYRGLTNISDAEIPNLIC